MKKTILLTFISVSLLFLFLQFPRNDEWFDKRILAYWSDFRNQKNHSSIEERKIKRWKTSYTVSKDIAAFFAKKGNMKTVLVLIPPAAYFTEKGIDYDVPEPAVFYYYTGLRTTWFNSHNASNANWMVTANKGQYQIVPVIDKKVLVDSINVFKKYPLGL